MSKCKFSELKPGDWFDWCGVRHICVFCEGHPIGKYHGWSPASETRYFCCDDLVTPLPDCTGWDWQPEPEVWYRHEYGDLNSAACFYSELESQSIDRIAKHRPYIGYTIRRVWPDGRIEQEFVKKEPGCEG